MLSGLLPGYQGFGELSACTGAPAAAGRVVLLLSLHGVGASLPPQGAGGPLCGGKQGEGEHPNPAGGTLRCT